jgi:hypothetical protein
MRRPAAVQAVRHAAIGRYGGENRRMIVWRLKKANMASRFAHHRLVRTETNRDIAITSKWYVVVKQLN